MNVHRTSADTWVLPPKVASYLRLVPAEKVHYYLAGQEGPDRVNDIVSAGRPHESNKISNRTQDIVEPYAVFKKNNVFLTRSYHVENTGPIDLMNRVSSVGEYFKMVRTGDDDCNVGNHYMSCYNNTRIYNEDEDTGYTVTLMEALKNCMVFNDDGTPRQLDGMEDPLDFKDLEQVFWLRSETDASGKLLFKNIEIMGDIDPTFCPAENVANIARSMINSSGKLKDDYRQLDNALTQGAALVQYLANLPITASSGDVSDRAGNWQEQIAGMTSLDGIKAIATRDDKAEGQVAKAFVDALNTIVGTLGPLLGGSANLLLNPNNGRANQTEVDTLYENLFAYGLVPIARTGPNPVNVSRTRLNEALAAITDAIAPNLDNSSNVVPRVATILGQAGAAEARRLLLGLDEARSPDPAKGLEAVMSLLKFIEANPVMVQAQSASPTETAAIVTWARATQVYLTAKGTTKEFMGLSNLAISPNNRQLTEGKLPPTYRRASPLGLDERLQQDLLVFGKIGTSFWEQTPIMQAILAQHGQGNSAAGGGGQGGRGGFDSLFADEFGSASRSQSQQQRVGSLFPGGAEGQQAVDDLRARRSHLVDTGALLLGKVDPRLRFGVLSHNLEELNAHVTSGLERVVASAYFFMPWRRQSLESMLSRNIVPNFGIIGFRIGLYDMALGIKVGGTWGTCVLCCCLIVCTNHGPQSVVQGREPDGLHRVWQQPLHAGRRCHDHGALRKLHLLRQEHCDQPRGRVHCL